MKGGRRGEKEMAGGGKKYVRWGKRFYKARWKHRGFITGEIKRDALTTGWGKCRRRKCYFPLHIDT